ncbi:hypothetical protein H1Q59_06930 [Holosporaceae bacterium 'Namur']|nr:hypothetical protein [Holosporaceae bacterium 'Namur']
MLFKLDIAQQKIWSNTMKIYESTTRSGIKEETISEPEFITEYRKFYHTIKNFKLHGNEFQEIKSLRREVFGVSADSEIMDKILHNKAKFLSTTHGINIVQFLTRRELICNGALNLPDIPQLYKQDIEIIKARKYEKIALLRISIEDIKNQNKWKNTYLYSANMHDVRSTYELVQLTRIYHTIPCFADIHIHDNPQLFGEVFSALSFHTSLNYPLLGFQRCNDISSHYKIIEELLIGEQLFHEGLKYEGLIIGENNFKKLLQNQYDNNIQYILFIYGVATGGNSSEWYHTSAMVGEIRNRAIHKIINLDGYGYHYSGTYEEGKRIGIPFIRIIIGGIKQGEKYEQDLQPASWNNMNCIVYAADLLKSFIYTYIKNPEQLGIAISKLENTSETKIRYLPNKVPKTAMEQFVYLMVDINKGKKLAELYEPLFDNEGYINIHYPITYCDEVRLKLAQRYLEDWGQNNASSIGEVHKTIDEKHTSIASSREYLRRSISPSQIREQREGQDNLRTM